MKISFSTKFAKRSLGILLVVALGLCLTSLAAQLYSLVFSQNFLPYLLIFNLENGIQILDARLEMSVPNTFSSALLLLCSVMFAGITFEVKSTTRRYTLRWGALAIVFLLLFIDEQLEIHDRLGNLFESLGTSRLFEYTWYVLAGAFVTIFAVAYLQFLFDLPAQTRQLFVAAGTLYILGALGGDLLELIVGMNFSSIWSPPAIVIGTIEEFLEMTGAILLLYALMRYTSHRQEPG